MKERGTINMQSEGHSQEGVGEIPKTKTHFTGGGCKQVREKVRKGYRCYHMEEKILQKTRQGKSYSLHDYL